MLLFMAPFMFVQDLSLICGRKDSFGVLPFIFAMRDRVRDRGILHVFNLENGYKKRSIGLLTQ